MNPESFLGSPGPDQDPLRDQVRPSEIYAVQTTESPHTLAPDSNPTPVEPPPDPRAQSEPGSGAVPEENQPRFRQTLRQAQFEIGCEDSAWIRHACKKLNMTGITRSKKEVKVRAVSLRMLQVGATVHQLTADVEEFQQAYDDMKLFTTDEKERVAKGMHPRSQEEVDSIARRVREAEEPYLKARRAVKVKETTSLDTETNISHCLLEWTPANLEPKIEVIDTLVYVVEISDEDEGRASGDAGTGLNRAQPFTANEWARLMHTMADPRMATARKALTQVWDKALLDAPATEDIKNCWDEKICHLFNDATYKPASNTNMSDGVSLSDVVGIDPSLIPVQLRGGGTLRDKWGLLRSAYTICLSAYEASGQNNPENFPNFAHLAGTSCPQRVIMYFRCFSNTSAGAVVLNMATRLISDDCQQEEGLGLPSSKASKGSERVQRQSKKAKSTTPSKSEKQEITLRGLEVDPEEQRLLNEKSFGDSIHAILKASDETDLQLNKVRKRLQAISKAKRNLDDDEYSSDEEQSLHQKKKRLKSLSRSLEIRISNLQDKEKQMGGEESDIAEENRSLGDK